MSGIAVLCKQEDNMENNTEEKFRLYTTRISAKVTFLVDVVADEKTVAENGEAYLDIKLVDAVNSIPYPPGVVSIGEWKRAGDFEDNGPVTWPSKEEEKA